MGVAGSRRSASAAVRWIRVQGGDVQSSQTVETSWAPLLGDEQFEELFRNVADRLFSYVARRVGPDVGEEIVAQVFAEAWNSRGRFQAERGDPAGWLFGIASNLLRRHYQRETRRLRAYDRAASEARGQAIEPDWSGDVVDRLAATDEHRAVSEALARLGDVDRDVLLLHAWADLSHAQIADALDVEIGTVKSRLSRARARLAAAVHTQGGLP